MVEDEDEDELKRTNAIIELTGNKKPGKYPVRPSEQEALKRTKSFFDPYNKFPS